MGAPDDCNIKDFVENNWFASIRMWLNIQRQIHVFHMNYYQRRDKPKIRNFAVIPMCSFQRRHIRIDTQALYKIICHAKKVPQVHGARVNKDGTPTWKNTSEAEFFKDKLLSWNLFFDVEKMARLVHFKQAFNYQICSDGVSASIMFNEPKHPPVEPDDSEVLKMYRSNRFVYELGVDPGERTYNATVRRCIATGEEVKFVIKMYIKFHYNYYLSVSIYHLFRSI